MSAFTWVAIGGFIAWNILIAIVLAWLAAAKEAGERYDQIMADQCPDEVEP